MTPKLKLEPNLEQQIQETETRFRVMADHAPVALWMSGTNALCAFFNQGWLNFTGRTMEQELGVGWAEGVHAEDFQRCMDTYLDAFNARTPFTMEYRLKRHDGEYRWILDKGVPRYTPDGTFAGYIGSCIDITDQKKAQDELANTVQQLQGALKSRDDFLSIASHELLTPLTPLKLQLHTMRRQTQKNIKEFPKSETLLKAMDVLDTQVDRLTLLIQNILEVSRIRAGRLTYHIEEVDLVQIIHDVTTRCRIPLTQAHCTLTLSVPSKIIGLWDKQRLEEVITNLLNNAIKYGAGHPIEISAIKDFKKAQLKIQDQGVGISKEDQIRILNRFERVMPLESFGGLGLGLYITQQIVQGLGGTIQVESVLGKGSTFIVELPLKNTFNSASQQS